MRFVLTVLITFLFATTISFAQTTAPATQEASSAEASVEVAPAPTVDVTALRTLSIQDQQVLKTWDTYARQKLAIITGRSTFEGQEPLYTVLDMACRPEAYLTRNVIKVKHVPLREDIGALPGVSKEEAERIRVQGTISLAFWLAINERGDVARIQNAAVTKTEAIGQVAVAANALQALHDEIWGARMAIVPPVKGGDAKWHGLFDLRGNLPTMAAAMGADQAMPKRIEGYDDARLENALKAWGELMINWTRGDSAAAQTAVENVARTVPAVLPDAYPSELKRKAEVIYNRSAQLTLPGAFLYFIAFSTFLVAARTRARGIHRAAVFVMLLGLLVHSAGVLVRWWLVEKSTDDWFHSIPIKNQFESVMMAAWFGGILGLLLETGLIQRIVRAITGSRFTGGAGIGIYGAGASFVGFLALVALFTVPYVFGKEIGGQIGQVNGILMSYWLYIHVTLAVFSYALIGMSFLLGIWWLVKYVVNAGVVSQITNPRQLSADAVDENFEVTAGGTLASRSPTAMFATLDACNLVVLQLAFWILGVAIVFGAIWADVSWGRPWGWDPKETFALVTWIVYLIIVHLRFVTKHKAFWTAVLSIVGFFIMLFNWVGVNYFLVGLHSYA
jgi:cytochrome c-type biogenesis protein CcsB